MGSGTRREVRSGPRPVSGNPGNPDSVLQAAGHHLRLVEQGGGSSGAGCTAVHTPEAAMGSMPALSRGLQPCLWSVTLHASANTFTTQTFKSTPLLQNKPQPQAPPSCPLQAAPSPTMHSLSSGTPEPWASVWPSSLICPFTQTPPPQQVSPDPW